MSSQRTLTIAAPIRNVIGFDDGPPGADGRVPMVGIVYCDDRLDGMITTTIEPDGDDATDAVAAALLASRFHQHVGAVLLQGVTFGGFNVLDVAELSARIERPVIVVCRRRPDRDAIRQALTLHFADGAERYRRIRDLPAPVAVGPVQAQWQGLDEERAVATLRCHCRHGHLPEPLRVAHLIAAALSDGHSRGGA